MTIEPYQVHLLIVEDDQGRRELILDGSLYSIGRDSKCDIRLMSQFASRRHATLVQLSDEGGNFYYRIVDGNLKGKPSANGLKINGRKLRAHDLEDGDRVEFGPKVSATYYSLKGGDPTLPVDTLESTIIHPSMVGSQQDDHNQ